MEKSTKGAAWHRRSILDSLGFEFQQSPKNIRGKIINGAEIYQQHWLEESELWLEIFDQTHLVLASGKPVLQKSNPRMRRNL